MKKKTGPGKQVWIIEVGSSRFDGTGPEIPTITATPFLEKLAHLHNINLPSLLPFLLSVISAVVPLLCGMLCESCFGLNDLAAS